MNLGGCTSIYIEMTLRAIVLQHSVLVLIAVKVVTQLRAIELLALMFTGDTKIHYHKRSTIYILTYFPLLIEVLVQF